ncbi:hypothetical protein FXV77_08525 [Sphingobacterium phlebotomi]|uniref:Fimbrillin-like protein n=1 Tax=Sphingobacterium phlebotomi TaxID=2605433 RepID=A0A5D4H9M4_9SPHI|nr:hypothetical protein [Sphingobacterium phlebotomi]TYR36539.1 hypothetical protein FXV77_08525 [Sphingobacterium phlebotomi]
MKINSTTIIWCLFLALFVTASCNNKENGVYGTYDGVKLKVNLTRGIVTDDLLIKNNNKSSISGSKASVSKGLQTQTQVVSLGDDLNIVAEFIPETESPQIRARQSAAGGLKAAATEVKTSLEIGTQYRLLLFKNGLLEYQQDYTVQGTPHTFTEIDLGYNGAGGAGTGLNLGTGAYTLIAYSAGTDAIPDLEGATLDDFQVTITEDHDKFMHFAQPLQIDSGENTVDVVLVNKLTEITTVIDGTNLGANSVKEIFQPRFESATHSTDANNRATVKLSDGSMTYPGTAVDKAIDFPTIPTAGVTVATSSPTVLVHDATSTASFRIPYVTVQGMTPDGLSDLVRKEVVFNDIVITPGVKYELRLRLNRGRCMIDVEKEYFEMDMADPNSYDERANNAISKIFEFSPTANGGVVLDIMYLDNSFNMVINGQPLANDEIDFQINGDARQTARFTDGTYHEDGNITDVWNMYGTEEAPIIRLIISPEGNVTMEGCKTAGSQANPGGGPLFPMELYGTVGGDDGDGVTPVAFNTVTWHADGVTPNVVRVSQNIVGDTEIKAFVGGKQIVDCNTGLPVTL